MPFRCRVATRFRPPYSSRRGQIEDGRWFWEERAKYLLACLSGLASQASLRDAAGLPARIEQWRDRLSGVADDGLPERLVPLVDELRGLAVEERTAAMETLEALLVRHDPQLARPFITWAQARDLAAAGIELGNHTVTHPDLRGVTTGDVVDEVRRAHASIAEQTGRPAESFAYPYGSHDAGVRHAVQEAGAVSALPQRAGSCEPDRTFTS